MPFLLKRLTLGEAPQNCSPRPKTWRSISQSQTAHAFQDKASIVSNDFFLHSVDNIDIKKQMFEPVYLG